MTVVTKIEHRSQTVVFSMYLQNHQVQLNSDLGKSVQHNEIQLWSNFCCNPIGHVRVIALLQRICIFKCYFFRHYLTIETKPCMNVPWGILHRTDVGIFDSSSNMGAVTKNRIQEADSSSSYISPKPSGLVKFFQKLK